MVKDSNSSISPETALVITCEHGGNQIPIPYRHLFRNSSELLGSHYGFDPGALIMARAMANKLSAPLLVATTSRLLVDLNRSIGHRNLHMPAVNELPDVVRQRILEQYYYPYRNQAEKLVSDGISRCGRVVHISCHSFTDCLDGTVRHADIGLLYDPARVAERSLCRSWKSALKAVCPDLLVRRNFPYQGRNDGLTSTLRKTFRPDAYLGIELELNQKHTLQPASKWSALRETVISCLNMALREFPLSAGAAS